MKVICPVCDLRGTAAVYGEGPHKIVCARCASAFSYAPPGVAEEPAGGGSELTSPVGSPEDRADLVAGKVGGGGSPEEISTNCEASERAAGESRPAALAAGQDGSLDDTPREECSKGDESSPDYPPPGPGTYPQVWNIPRSLAVGGSIISCCLVFLLSMNVAPDTAGASYSTNPSKNNSATNLSGYKPAPPGAPAESVAQTSIRKEEQGDVTTAPRAEIKQAPPKAIEREASWEGFTVQVGSHSDKDQADTQAAKLRAAGFEARVVRANIPGKGIWYRVQAGRSETREEATRSASKLLSSGLVGAGIVVEAGN